MHVHAKIQKWGNGLGLRVSGVMRDVPGFHVGAEIDVDVTEQGLTIRKVMPQHFSAVRYTEEQLLADLDRVTAHSELLAELSISEIDPHGS